MTWITLHQRGEPRAVNMALIAAVVPAAHGSTLYEHGNDGDFWIVDETHDQVRALTAEAEYRDEYRRAAIRKELGL